MDTIIRPANFADINVMYAISLAAHQQGYEKLIPEQMLSRFKERYGYKDYMKDRYNLKMHQRIGASNWEIWVAAVDSRVVGFTLGEFTNEFCFVKHGLFVEPTYQGQGIGKRLFERSLESLEHGTIVTLEVIENNHVPIAMYNHYGFIDEGRSGNTFYGAYLRKMRLTIDRNE